MQHWLHDNVYANGIHMHYVRTGGALPPVVLAHGITDNGLCWGRLAKALAGEYDLIMYDARGHGQSDAPEHGYSTEERAADLAGLVHALRLDRPVLIGHSMGADTSAMAAAHYPDLLRGVVLEDPPWSFQSTLVSAADVTEWRNNVITQKHIPIDALIEQGRINAPTWDASEMQPWAEAKQQVSPNVFNWLAKPRTPWRAYVAQINCPALLVTGDPEHGAIVTPEGAQEAAQLCPHLHVIRINGAGHNIRREQFAPFLGAVTTFLRAAF